MGYNLSKLRVLVVDDSKNMRMLVKTVLQALGIVNIKEASDGSAAMKELKASAIDIAIVDWVMEPTDGLEFVRQVRTAEDSPNPFLPIIMLTGFAERHPILCAHGHGFRESDHRRQVRERAVQVPHRVAEAAPLRRDDLQEIADGWRVDRTKEFELAWRHHDVFPGVFASRAGVGRPVIP